MKRKKCSLFLRHWTMWSIRAFIALVPLTIAVVSAAIVFPIYLCSGIKKCAKEL